MSSPYQPYPQDSSGGYGQPPQDGWDPSQQGYLQGGPVGFGEAVSEGFKNLVTFNGRASRSAFWWFFVGAIIIDVIGAIIGRAAHAVAIQYIIYAIVAVGTLSLSVRRLHDSGKSGFWWLIGFIPLIGTITLIVFYCLPGRLGPTSTTHSGTARGESVGQWLAGEVHHRGIRENAAVLAVLEIPD